LGAFFLTRLNIEFKVINSQTVYEKGIQKNNIMTGMTVENIGFIFGLMMDDGVLSDILEDNNQSKNNYALKDLKLGLKI
jgi:hypothetical protein